MGMHTNIRVFDLRSIEPDYFVLYDPDPLGLNVLEFVKGKPTYKIIDRESGFQLLKKSR